MEHAFIDKYSDLNSIIHRLDPRIKIISFFLYIFFVILTPPTEIVQFVEYLTIIFIVILITHIPLVYVFKRSFVIIPFVLLIAIFIPFFKKDQIGGAYNLSVLQMNVSYDGLLILWNVLIKSWLAVLSMTVISSTTKFPMILKGLEHLRIPKILIMLLSFMYRYIFVLIDESMRMERARSSRYFGGGYLRQMRVIANMIGVLFIRAYERGEKVYQSMLARGFDGEVKVMNKLELSKLDFLFSFVFLGILIIIKWRIL